MRGTEPAPSAIHVRIVTDVTSETRPSTHFGPARSHVPPLLHFPARAPPPFPAALPSRRQPFAPSSPGAVGPALPRRRRRPGADPAPTRDRAADRARL